MSCLYSSEFSESLDRRSINLSACTCKTNKKMVVMCLPPLDTLSQIRESGERKNPSFSIKNVLSSLVSFPPPLWRREVVRSSWEVDDFLPKRKAKVAHSSHVMTCSSL